jgi:hypothetical protein
MRRFGDRVTLPSQPIAENAAIEARSGSFGRMRLSVLLPLVLFAVSARADDDHTPVVVRVVGNGHIRLIVADGQSKPCDSSNNKLLLSKEVYAGDEIHLVASSGSVCVDHTYGAFRDSQWAGPSIWSGALLIPSQSLLTGRVSTDVP